jgi:hypothetical protein
VPLGDEEREHCQHESLISKSRGPRVCGVLLLELLSQSLNGEATSAEVEAKKEKEKKTVSIVALDRLNAYRI